MLSYNSQLKTLAKNLRKSLTNAEKLLWSKLRMKQLKNKQFYRQKIIGNYIVDFYCPSSELIIELDGGQHFENDKMIADGKRDEYLRNLGLKVLRFPDNEVFRNTNVVLQLIYENL